MAKTSTKKKIQYWGTGRRKSAIARVRLIPGGAGNIVINKRGIDDYCDLETVKLIIKQPLVAVLIALTFVSIFSMSCDWSIVKSKWLNLTTKNVVFFFA